MPTTLDEKAARAAINRTIGDLKDKHPRDCAEE
jgi:hypothetical protein